INIALASIRDELQARGFYAAVASIEPVISPDFTSVAVTLTVDAGPRVQVRWTGDPRPIGREEDPVPISPHPAAHTDLMADSRVRSEDAPKAEGYVNARVTFTKDTSTPGVLTVTYDLSRGPRFRVERVSLPDGLHMTTPTLEALIPIRQGDVFSQARVDAASNAIKIEYRRRGFYQVAVDSGHEIVPRASQDGEVWVVVSFQVTEGPQGFVSAIQFSRDTAKIPEPALRGRMRSREHEPYVPGFVVLDRDALAAFYLDRGFRA